MEEALDKLYTIITIIIGFFTTGAGAGLIAYFKTHTKEAKEKKKLERQAEIQQAVVKELEPVREALRDTTMILKELKKENKKQSEAIQILVKEQLRDNCKRCIEKGYKTEEDVEYITRLHKRYEELGKNGLTDSLYEEYLKLKLIVKEKK